MPGYKITAGSLIQSDFPDPCTNYKYHNFEAIILEDQGLTHYFRENKKDAYNDWMQRPNVDWFPTSFNNKRIIISQNATGPGCIIQSDYKVSDGVHGTFEVIVPEDRNLVWYRLQNDRSHWISGSSEPITSKASGPASLIQSDFYSGTSSQDFHGDFDLVVQENNSSLVHYRYEWDSDTNTRMWKRKGYPITSKAAGPGCIIQSSFLSRDNVQNVSHGILEVVVPETDGKLAHYRYMWDNIRQVWGWGPATFSYVTDKVTGPACIIQSKFKDDVSAPGNNFEVVALEDNNLIHYWHPNHDLQSGWNEAQVVTTSATGPATIINSDFRNFEGFDILVQECIQSVIYYWLKWPKSIWNRHPAPILWEPYYHPPTHPKKNFATHR
jgi:hypothetical protein